MRYPGHYLLCYISYWLHCLWSRQATPLSLDPARSLCTVERGGWRLHSCNMQTTHKDPALTPDLLPRPRFSNHVWTHIAVKHGRKEKHSFHSGIYSLLHIQISPYAGEGKKVTRSCWTLEVFHHTNEEPISYGWLFLPACRELLTPWLSKWPLWVLCTWSDPSTC